MQIAIVINVITGSFGLRCWMRSKEVSVDSLILSPPHQALSIYGNFISVSMENKKTWTFFKKNSIWQVISKLLSSLKNRTIKRVVLLNGKHCCYCCCCFTRVVVEDDVDEVLVTPGDVEFVLLEEGHQELFPAQTHRRHVILFPQTRAKGKGHNTCPGGAMPRSSTWMELRTQKV